MIVALFTLRFSVMFIVSGFFVLEVLRFSLMSFVSIIYASASSKNIMTRESRRNTILTMICGYIVSAVIVSYLGYQLFQRLITIKSFAMKMCLDQ